MSGIIEAKEEVEVDNATSDTDDSGTFIEEEVYSDENETESAISSNQESGISSNQHDERKASANTTSTSVGARNVDRSSKVEFDNPRLKDRMGVIISSAAKKYIKNVESTQSEKHGQYTKSRELFQPGKFKSDEIWKPNQSQENYPHATITKTQTPRRSVQSFNYAARNNQYGGSTKQPSYHVPPCTNRTRKAQEEYTKHVEIVTTPLWQKTST